MKRFIILILILSGSSVAYATDNQLINDFSIPVTFTYRSGLNAGFSRSVPGTAWYESDLGTDGNEIRFKYDSMTGNIETGTFNFYVQIYTTSKVKVSVDASAMQGQTVLKGEYGSEEIEYSVIGSSLFSNVNGNVSGSVLLDESKGDVDPTRPRVFSYPINLSIQPDQLINLKSESFEGTIAFKVEVLS